MGSVGLAQIRDRREKEENPPTYGHCLGNMASGSGRYGTKDHKSRKDLVALIHEKRDVKPLPEDKKREKTTIQDEKWGPKTTSLKEIEEKLKASDIWELLSSGGSLSVPVVDYIKDKYKLLSVETTERLVKELHFLHQDLINKGFPREEVKHAINRDKKSKKKQESPIVDPKEEAKYALKQKYEQYQQFQNEDAEVKKLLEGLNLQ